MPKRGRRRIIGRIKRRTGERARLAGYIHHGGEDAGVSGAVERAGGARGRGRQRPHGDRAAAVPGLLLAAEPQTSSSGGPRKCLLLRLKRKWFDAIAAGYKRTEYRSATGYWEERIEGQRYDSIVFRNGYGDHRPTMEVEYKGWRK